MAQQYDALTSSHRSFIDAQRVFFTASATRDSRVNVSPREIGALRVLDDNRVAYLDLTGSGNETAAHVRADGRLTLMFCAFTGPPRILRLYGLGRKVGWQTDEFVALLQRHYGISKAPPGARQIMVLKIDLVQTSCGFGVPIFEYVGERTSLERFYAEKGADGMADYWAEKNLTSMDGLPTGLELPDRA